MSAVLGLKGKNAVVLGANPSGVELVRFLVRKGAVPVLADPAAKENLSVFLDENLDATKYRLEAGELQAKTFEGAQIVIVTAGFALDLPALEAARTAGVQVLTELEFVSLYTDLPIVAVAGTKGKSTTAHLLQQFLEANGKKVFTNIQAPLAQVLNAAQKFEIALFVSTSFQLEGIDSYKPQMVVLTNLSDDHLDRYPNIETYLASCREVFRNACAETISIINVANPHVQPFASALPGRKAYFGAQELADGFDGASGSRQDLLIRVEGKEVSLSLKNFRMRGPHNRENVMAAAVAALFLGAKPETLQGVVDNVRTLPHRLEFVRRLNSVAFYDDSCAANPDATLKSLQGFTEPVILISGGRDKNVDYSPLIPHIRQRVKNLILVGEAKEKINRSIGDYTETFLVGTMEEAILLAYQKSRSGDVILLSPACAPTDVFKDHADKGEFFQRLVSQIAQPRRPNVL
jgi:UDP-N-acetylmuramoylalanine--D-glutamate ligase